MSYYVHRAGQTLGPYSPGHVVNMLRAHQLAVEDLATEEGCEDWKPLGNIVDPALLTTPPPPLPAKVSPRKKTSTFTWICGGIFVLLLIGFVANSGNGPGNPATPAVTTEVTHNDFAVFVRNKDDYDWPTLTVYLNGSPLDGYKYEHAYQVPAGEEVKIPLAEFAKSNGDRFDPRAKKVKQVMVWVKGHDSPIVNFH